MSRFLETFCKIDVSRAKSQGPDLADLMNVSAPVLISADLCRMSQLACSFLMPKQRDSVNVSARVLISVDLCRMSNAVGSDYHHDYVYDYDYDYGYDYV